MLIFDLAHRLMVAMLEDVLTGMAWDGRKNALGWPAPWLLEKLGWRNASKRGRIEVFFPVSCWVFCLKQKTDAGNHHHINHHSKNHHQPNSNNINNTLLCKVATLGSFAQPFLMAVTAKPAASQRRWGLNSPWRNLWLGLERWIWKRWSTKKHQKHLQKKRQQQDQFHILPHRITWLRKTHGKPLTLASYDLMAAELEPQPGALKDAKISNTTAKVLQSFGWIKNQPNGPLEARPRMHKANLSQVQSFESPKKYGRFCYILIFIFTYNNYILYLCDAHTNTHVYVHATSSIWLGSPKKTDYPFSSLVSQ